MLTGLRSLIKLFMGLFKHKCAVCDAKDDLIAYLKSDITKREQNWQDERAEYKRTVDQLLVSKNFAPIGQGVPQAPSVMPNVNPMDMFKIFEEVPEGKDNG